MGRRKASKARSRRRRAAPSSRASGTSAGDARGRLVRLRDRSDGSEDPVDAVVFGDVRVPAGPPAVGFGFDGAAPPYDEPRAIGGWLPVGPDASAGASRRDASRMGRGDAPGIERGPREGSREAALGTSCNSALAVSRVGTDAEGTVNTVNLGTVDLETNKGQAADAETDTGAANDVDVHVSGTGAGEDPVDPGTAGGDRRNEQDDGWKSTVTRSGPWGALAERWVPEPLRGARISPGWRGAALLSAVAAIAAVVAAVGVWWSRPAPDLAPPRGSDGSTAADSEGRVDGSTPFAAAAESPPDGIRFFEAAEVPTGTDASDSAGSSVVSPDSARAAADADTTSISSDSASAIVEPLASDGAAAGAAPGDDSAADPKTNREGADGPILVSVTGKVHRPGLVSVPADARVADALAAAGGSTEVDALVGLNLAAHLRDGSSIVVAGPSGSSVSDEFDATSLHSMGASDGGGSSASGARGNAGGTASPAALVSINTADSATLETLPGVGPVTAQSIIEYRTKHGPFVELAQLQEVSGIGPATYARIAPRVTL